jgi:hypothetical protein
MTRASACSQRGHGRLVVLVQLGPQDRRTGRCFGIPGWFGVVRDGDGDGGPGGGAAGEGAASPG